MMAMMVWCQCGVCVLVVSVFVVLVVLWGVVKEFEFDFDLVVAISTSSALAEKVILQSKNKL